MVFPSLYIRPLLSRDHHQGDRFLHSYNKDNGTELPCTFREGDTALQIMPQIFFFEGIVINYEIFNFDSLLIRL